jgi:hypothetical protein
MNVDEAVDSDPYVGYPAERRRTIVAGEILRLQDQRYRHELTINICGALPDTLQTPGDIEEREVAGLAIQRLDVALARLRAELENYEGDLREAR